MQNKAFKLNQRFDELYNDLILEMARRRIFLVNETQLNDAQKKWVKKYFKKEVLPHITPLLMNNEMNVLQFLKDEYAYLTVELQKSSNPNTLSLRYRPITFRALSWFQSRKENAARPSSYLITLSDTASMIYLKAFSNTTSSTAMR